MSAAHPLRLLAGAAIAVVGAAGTASLVMADDDPAAAAAPPAATASTGAAGPAERALARRALGLVDIDPSALGVRLRITGPRPGVRASADTKARIVTLHVRREAAHRLAHDLAHELGHVVESDHLDAGARRRWARERGATSTPWWPGTTSDYSSLAGDFAEVYAACHAASPEFRSTVAPAPGDPCKTVNRFLPGVTE